LLTSSLPSNLSHKGGFIGQNSTIAKDSLSLLISIASRAWPERAISRGLVKLALPGEATGPFGLINLDNEAAVRYWERKRSTFMGELTETISSGKGVAWPVADPPRRP
jgi:hypothetical protein